MNNLTSHLSPDIIDVARQNRIELICLPPNSTHILQSLDVSVFISKNLTKLSISALTDNGQKYSLASNFPYVFHINILIFNKPGKHLKDNFTFNNNTIECVNDYKYLILYKYYVYMKITISKVARSPS
jgi:hypothetical protein